MHRGPRAPQRKEVTRVSKRENIILEKSPSDIALHTHNRNNLVRVRELFPSPPSRKCPEKHVQHSITILSVARFPYSYPKLPFIHGGTILLTRAGSFLYHLAATRTSSPRIHILSDMHRVASYHAMVVVMVINIERNTQ